MIDNHPPTYALERPLRGAGLRAFVAGLPKAELHLHFEGSIFPESRRRLAAANGIRLPESAYGLWEEYNDPTRSAAENGATNLTRFLSLFEASCAVLTTVDDFRRATLDVIGRSHDAGTIYLEMFFDPQAHTTRGVSMETVMTGLIAGRDEGRARYGVESALIMCFHRHRPADDALRILDLVEDYRADIVGVGLDDHEGGDWVTRFGPVFDEARRCGYRLTAHCDVDQPHAVSNIWRCLLELGVERIDHGINAIDEPALRDYLVRNEIPCTMCPTWPEGESRTKQAVAIRELRNRGVIISLNSDDPGLFVAGMVDSVMVGFCETVDVTPRELAEYARNSFRTAWIDDIRRRDYLRRVDDYLAAAVAHSVEF